MPKIVDHQVRREQIASGLMRVAANQGLDAISLRHVAAECGVTSGMVQHYFPTKDAMMAFAMESATTRYAARMAAAVERLGDEPSARDLVRTMMRTLLPADEAEMADARVTLAFLSYSTTRPAAAGELRTGNADLRQFLADQVRRAQESGEVPATVDPMSAGTGLLAAAEGLGLYVLSGDLSAADALTVLDAQLALVFIPR